MKGWGGTTPTTLRAVPPLLELLAVANAMASPLRLGAGAVASRVPVREHGWRPTPLSDHPPNVPSPRICGALDRPRQHGDQTQDECAMRDERGSPFDSVEQGPEAAEAGASSPGRSAGGDPGGHASVKALQSRFDSWILHHEVHAGDQHVVFVDAAHNLEILEWLRDDADQRYDLLADVTAVDYGDGKPIQVVYQLWAIAHKRALRVKCELPLDGLSIDSVVQLWNAANWLEREVFDLFGVDFKGHPDLRRILMPQNYSEGHPLRKDFPLRGRFSRAEQTRRALSQDYHDYYTPEALEVGGAPAIEPPTTHDPADEVEAS